jgi:RNA polymerase sigma-70 factor (ECF subfamily)
VLDEPSLAEDCVAETFSRYLDALRRGGGPQRYLKAHLYRTAHNWIVDNFRRSATATAHHDPVEVSDGQPAEVLAARLERQRVREALLRLAPEQRQEIVLKFLEAFTNEEVAAALGKSAGAVKSIQHRALDKLKDMLSERARRK